MSSHLFRRAVRTGLSALALISMIGVELAAARPEPGAQRTRRGFNLRAAPFTIFLVNRVACGINNLGEVCVDPGNSPIGGGGFWPKGTPDQYIFNTGLQVAGIIPKDAGFAWAGDTTGAYFMDPRGTQSQGDGVTLVYNSLEPDDAAAWPTAAIVRDADIFAPVLLGRNFASQQDLWVRSWDGNPTLLSGRKHPMGVLAETRGLAWNFPTGNEDILYFVYTVTNVTASDPAAYAGLDPAIRADIAALGQQYQDGVKARLNVTIPAGGYRMDSVYVAFFADMDVGDASHNFSTAVLPFNLGQTYKSDFRESGWVFPPDIFGPPLAAAPGFVGVKYLRSPINPATKKEVGLTMFSNTLNAATGFPDPVGVIQLWRYLSGNVSPAFGDNPCTVPNPKQRKLCYLSQEDRDQRFFQSSGPFSIKPGEQATIVVAYVHAAAVAQFITVGSHAPNAPGIPPSGAELVNNPALVRTIDRAMGWVSQTDKNADGVITQDEVVTLPRSLLQKSLVAQAIFDNKFLLPFSPDPPRFFLVPGTDQVTVIWEPSATEKTGDPFFAIASNKASPLFDPNFRNNDVEGYRVYRGRTSGDMQLIAQFDYVGTVMRDFNAGIDYGANCMPEATPPVTSGCPVAFDLTNFTVSNPVPIVSPFIQVPPGGRVLLGTGSALTTTADTAVTGGGTGFPPLEDTGVPFAFVDRSVRSSLTYFYAVTAFDVNSVKSGPTSLESARIAKSVTPRAPSGQEAVGKLQPTAMLAADGSKLNTAQPTPTLDKATGIFSGPFPPTDGITLGLAEFVPQLLTDGSVTLTIDSITPGSALTNARPSTYHLTAKGAGDPVKLNIDLDVHPFSGDRSNGGLFAATSLDGPQATRFGGDGKYSLYGQTTVTNPGTWRVTNWGRGSINGAPANSDQNGPRWWVGTGNEDIPKPNELVCPGAPGGCVQGDLSRNAGRLTGVSTLFWLQSYITVPNVPMRNLEAVTSSVSRAADFKVYWGAGGKVDSVIDVTHKVPVPFDTRIRASWGILNQASFASTNQALTRDGKNTLLTWSDVFCIAPAHTYTNNCGAAAQTPAVLQNTAALSPIAATASSYANTATLAQTGTGFVFYLNGHFFLMQMAALPAAGTVWNARFYTGTIVGTGAAGDYQFIQYIRPPAVPGLRLQVAYTGSKLDRSVTDSALLAKVHTVPDPYYATNALELSPNLKVLKFVNLPAQCMIRIYSLSGVLVDVITHNDPTGGGEASWDLRNRNNQFVASGVYFYHVETPDGKQKVGRFTVVNFAQ